MRPGSALWPLILMAAMGGHAMAAQPAPVAPAVKPDAISVLVGQLSIDRYKADIKALTRYGDRRQGTKRNRDAINWIESQLKSYGCPTARLSYVYDPARRFRAAVPAGGGFAVGGGRPRGFRRPTAPNTNPMAQPDAKLRQLDSEIAPPGPREEVYCTKTGSGHPGEMYIVSAHMDGIGYGEAANDDGSGTALVMEVARVLNSPGVRTDRSVRFILWNNEETGLDGARAYVTARRALEGKEDPGFRPVSRTQMAGVDSARHGDVRPRNAPQRRHRKPGAAAGSRPQRGISVGLSIRSPVPGACLGAAEGQ
jgi:acetylornithine deacetylase/succinyl-diaminopimelate desuccinylase-like protein